MIILAAAVLVYAFYSVMDDIMNGSISFMQIGGNKAIEDHWMLELFPVGLQRLLMWAEFYICQGYYGFSLATEMDWIPMFGSGFSRWLCLEIDSIVPVYQYTYVYRIGEVYKWDASANWHTAYTWFANDISLLGVIGLMLFLGYILQRSFDNSDRTANPFSVGLLTLMLQLVLFLPCNNLVFSDSKSLFSFFVFLIGYFLTKDKTVTNEGDL